MFKKGNEDCVLIIESLQAMLLNEKASFKAVYKYGTLCIINR